MGLNIRDIVPRKEINFQDLRGKVIAVDAYNAIYQFLSSIRQYDGTPLQDRKGNITSHLSGLFYRNINLLAEGIKLVYVFDGQPPELKSGVTEKRAEVKAIAKEKFEKAKLKEDYALMKKYSQQLARVDEQMISESKELLEAMGIMVVQAPGEGEAQASYLAKLKDIYAVASQDYDCLAFGSPRLIQNLTLARKRKTISGYVEIKPEIIELEKVLNSLNLNQDQLISLAILTGTDYNPGGVKGIGQKRALEIVRRFKQPALIFRDFELEFDWKEIFELFKKPNIEKGIRIKFPKIDKRRIKEILISHDFSEERIEKQLEKFEEAKDEAAQKTLF